MWPPGPALGWLPDLHALWPLPLPRDDIKFLLQMETSATIQATQLSRGSTQTQVPATARPMLSFPQQRSLDYCLAMSPPCHSARCCGRNALLLPTNPGLAHHLLWPAECVEVYKLLKILCHSPHSGEESVPHFVPLKLIWPVTCSHQRNVAE